MNEGLIPNRYAKALIKAAAEKNCQSQLYGIMLTLSSSLDSNPALMKTVANPFVESDKKIKLLSTAADIRKESAAAKLYVDFLNLLVKNKRIDFIQEIALNFQRIYRQENNIYLVRITTAGELPEKETDKLIDLVQAQLPEGASIQLEKKVDPSLIGGFSIAIDNSLIDASVKNQLKQLRSNLISQ